MTTISHEPSTPARRTHWLYLRDVWASLAISAMWLAVVVVSLCGSDVQTFDVSGSHATIPSGVVLGLFAAIGVVAVAKYGYTRTRND